MTHIDLLIVVVAALLVFELRRRLGRSRRDTDEKPVGGGLDGYLRSLRDRRGATPANKSNAKGVAKDAAQEAKPDLPFEEAFAKVRDSRSTPDPLAPAHLAGETFAPPAPRSDTPEELTADEQAVLQPLREHQPNFRLREFLGGAKYAYEAILEGFASNDFATLDELLSEPARGAFFQRMKERRVEKQWRAANLVSIEEAKIIETRVEQGVAFVAVRFVSEQFESLRFAKRAGGRANANPSNKDEKDETGPLVRVRELWTFRRPLDSPDPNWTVSAVAS